MSEDVSLCTIRKAQFIGKALYKVAFNMKWPIDSIYYANFQGYKLQNKTTQSLIIYWTQCSKFPVVQSSMTTKNKCGRLEFVTKLSEWQPEIFFYPDAEIYSFQVLRVDFPKLPLNKIRQ